MFIHLLSVKKYQKLEEKKSIVLLILLDMISCTIMLIELKNYDGSYVFHVHHLNLESHLSETTRH